MLSEGLNITKKTLLIVTALALCGCAPVISSEWRKEARKDLTFEQVLRNPNAYKGSIVIWGGIIINTNNRPDGTLIAVLETPLGSREKPESNERSSGRFIATTAQFLDPAIYSKGRKITVAGEIISSQTQTIANSSILYTYPVIAIKQIHLWELPEYFQPDYMWYGAPDDFWWGEGFYGGPVVRGHGEESRESPAEERTEGARGEAAEHGGAGGQAAPGHR